MGKLRYLALGTVAALASLAVVGSANALTVTVWGGFGNPDPGTGVNRAQDRQESGS